MPSEDSVPAGDPVPSGVESLDGMDAEAAETLADTPVEETTESCGSEAPKLMIRIAIKNEEGQPVPEVPYHLKVGDEEWESETDSEGLVEQEVPADSTEGVLNVWRDGDKEKEPEELHLELAKMDPLGMDTGREARLFNLGFAGFDPEGEQEGSLEEALIYFQLWAGLPSAEAVDEEAEEVLGALYDPLGTEEPFDPFDNPEKAIEGEEDAEAEEEPPSGSG